ncbi:hypothetical protein EV715DRAFT_172465, partial [Schizophyllum commune]
HNLGNMTVSCSSCRALHWNDERLTSSKKNTPIFGLCCDSGQVRLPLLAQPPPFLYHLYESDSTIARAFRKHIRQYNNAFAFTSLGVQEDRALNMSGRSAWVFRIHGELCHYSSALERTDAARPCFAQVYIYDPAVAHAHRVANNDNLDSAVLMELERELRAYNPYARIYQHAYEVLSARESYEDALIRLRVVPGQDRRRYNRPAAEEVAMILPGDVSASKRGRDIVIRRRTPLGDHHLFRITELHAAYAPLQFILLFPRGESGWHDELRM